MAVMCPFWPLHLVVLYLVSCAPILLMFMSCVSASVNSSILLLPDKLERVAVGATGQLTIMTSQLSARPPDPAHMQQQQVMYHVTARRGGGGQRVVEVTPRQIVLRVDPSGAPGGRWLNHTVNVTGVSLGYTCVRVKAVSSAHANTTQPLPAQNVSQDDGAVSQCVPVSVVRDADSRRLDTIFGACVAVLMAVTYVNMGCTLDLQVIADQLRRPVAPVIGLVCQYVIMPLVGFSMALLCLQDPGMQLGLFLTGCSPGGGASNIWTYLLDANVNLSVTMTFVSSIVAFAAVPAWVYVLGGVLVRDTAADTVVVPYTKIATLLVSLLLPCLIGLLIQRYLPKLAHVLRVILKPWSVFLFIFIVAFGIYCNQHLANYLSWQLLLAAGSVPLLGMLGGAMASLVTGRNWQDAVAISIETGVQNTGVAIFMLKFSLPEPANDIAILAPIVVASMTPVPLFAAILFRKLRVLVARDGASMSPHKKPAVACGDLWCNGGGVVADTPSGALVSVTQINSLQP